MGAVLLRKALSVEKSTLWIQLDQDTCKNVKETLLNSIQNEEVAYVRRTITDTIASVGSLRVEETVDTIWPELFPFALEHAMDSTLSVRLSCLQILRQMSIILLTEGLAPFMEDMLLVLRHSFEDPNSDVRVAASSCALSTVMVLDGRDVIMRFSDFIPVILAVFGDLLNAGDFENAETVSQSFVDCICIQEELFRPYIEMMASSFYQVAAEQSIPHKIRHACLEFFVLLTERRPAIVRKMVDFVSNVLHLFLNMMVVIDHDHNWEVDLSDDEEDSFSYPDHEFARGSLDTWSMNLGGDLVFPIVYGAVQTFARHESWQYRYVALTAMMQIAEGAKSAMMPHLSEILQFCTEQINDAHIRVQCAAMNCIGQLSHDFAPKLQKLGNKMGIIPILIELLDSTVPRLVLHSGMALVNFIVDCKRSYVEPYIEQLMSKGTSCLGMHYKVQDVLLGILATVADVIEEDFGSYYGLVVPILQEIISNAVSKEERALRGKAFQVYSIVGKAVGKEVFLEDGKLVMQALLETQNAIGVDDPQVPYLLEAWTNISKCLGEDFGQYIHVVLPALLSAASQEAEFVVSETFDSNPTEEREDMNSVVVTIKGIGDKRVSVNTHILQEKVSALAMVYTYANDVAAGFYPFVADVSQIVIPLFRYEYMEEVRMAAWQIGPKLIDSAFKAGHGDVGRALFTDMLPEFLYAIIVEVRPSSATVAVDCLMDAINALGQDQLNDTECQSIVETIQSVHGDIVKRREELWQNQQDQQLTSDELEELEEEMEEDDELLSQIQDLSSALLKTNVTKWVPAFMRNLWPFYFERLLSPQNVSSGELHVALCMTDELVESANLVAHPMFMDVLQTMIQCCDPSIFSAKICQAAVYGIGSVVEHSDESVSMFVPQMIEGLVKAFSHEEARENDWASVTCNAVSSLYKILVFKKNCVSNPGEMWSVWLSMLPVGEDLIEANIVHSILANEVLQENEYIISAPIDVLCVFANIIGSEGADEDATNLILQAISHMQSVGLVGKNWNRLPQDVRNILSQVMG
jgi:importin-5